MSPLRISTTWAPITASMPKKKIVTADENTAAATRHCAGSEFTKPENPICAPRNAASAPA